MSLDGLAIFSADNNPIKDPVDTWYREAMIKRTSGVGCLALLVAGLALVGCSEPESEVFTLENKGAFLAACVDPEVDAIDAPLTAEICGCTYDRALEQYTDYNDFVAVDKQLASDPEAPIPQELLDLMAACLIAEADL